MKKINHHPPAHPSHHPKAKNVCAFIRNNKKQALLVHTPQHTQFDHLAKVISQRLKVPASQQILYLNGRQLSSRNSQIDITDRAVIYLVDRRNIGRQITINIRRLNMSQPQQYTIPSSQVIQDFIVRHVGQEQADQSFLVYTGRHLRKQYSFEQQNVQDQSQIFCLHQEKDEVRGEKRQYYQKRLKEERMNRQRARKYQNKDEEQSQGELWNYLPKDSQVKKEKSKFQSKSQQEQQQKQPNFKKKNALQQVNISKKPSMKKSHIQGSHLSELHQNPSALNSQYFNEGSSISEIIAYDSHNPESNKKLQQGSMFNSAYMGLNNQPSIVNQGRIAAQRSRISQQNQLERSAQPQSFNFDTRAPQMLPQTGDRHFTVLQRQIQQVTEQSIEEDESREKNRAQVSPNDKKQADGSQEHSQFEFGQIQNHLLSASTEMRVGDPTSSPKIKSKNQILIEEEEQNQQELKLNNLQNSESPKQPKRNKKQQVQLFTINQNSQQSIESKNTHTRQPSKQQMEFQPQAEHVQIIMIQGEGANPSELSEVVNQKQQCQTNHPSSSSNFFSKNSSRVQNPNKSNEYEFGAYGRQIARPGIQSRNIDRMHSRQQQLNENTKSQCSKSFKANQGDKMGVSSDEVHVQAIDLPLDVKVKQGQFAIKNMSSLMEKEYLMEKEQNKKSTAQQFFKTSKDVSKIEQLNKLVEGEQKQPITKSEKSEIKSASKSQKAQSDLLSQGQSQVQIDTSINNRVDPQNIRSSQQSLEQVSIKKTLMSYVSGSKMMENQIKSTPHKQNFAPANLIFKADLTPFDPLEFYISLLQKESSNRQVISS